MRPTESRDREFGPRSGTMHIRRLVDADLPHLVPLHRSAFGAESTLPDSILVRHLREVFLEGPWARSNAPDSLVCVDSDQKIVGFVGVFRSQWVLDGAPCSVAVTSQVMADRDRAAPTAIMNMLRRVMGMYDLVISDGASDAIRQIWNVIGGETLIVPSLEWVRPLRPTRTMSDIFLSRAGAFSRLRPIVSCATLVPDALAARVRPNCFDKPINGLHEESLDDAAFAEHRRAIAERYRLAPRYSDNELAWLLRQIGRRRVHGDVRAVLLKGDDGGVQGWYLYHWRRHSNARVVELQCLRSSREKVLRHLFRDAWLHGATAVTGSARQDLIPQLSDMWCYFRGGAPWTLAFSQRADVRLALQSGESWFSRLDSEDWMQFLGETPSPGQPDLDQTRRS